MIKYLFIIIFGIVTTSCIVYHAQSVDIPLICDKNELKIDGGISLLPSANMTISYGLTKKFAIQAFGNYDISSDERFYFQGSAGYFKNLSNNKVIELYGGFGTGYGKAYKDASGGHLFGRFNLYFTQFNFGKINIKPRNVEYGFGIKTGLLRSDLTDQNYYDRNKTAPFKNYIDNSFLIEPTFFVRLGGEKLKINFKFGVNWIYKFINQSKIFPYFPLSLGISLNYKL